MSTCTPCNVPQDTLTLSWTNAFTGPGSVSLAYLGGSLWASASCADSGLLFQLNCSGGGGAIELRAIFFTSGTCPSGVQQYCSNLRVNPLALTLSSHTCSPLSLTFDVNGSNCPTLFGAGNTQFVVTYP